MRNKKTFIAIILLGMMLGGCASKEVNRSSSIVEYLYPHNTKHIEKESIPHLNLPLRVGIAFVPEQYLSSKTLTQRNKSIMMQKVSQHFQKLDFVQAIEIIPSVYLRKNGSFNNLSQIKKMYDIDVIALISFDQTQFTDKSFLAFTYWTIIGAYIIPAEKNDTHTMLDIVVYDITSKKMLFRAPGMYQSKSHATYMNLSEQLRKDSYRGFEEAQKAMIQNLDIQLKQFKTKVKNNPTAYKVTRSKGYTGGSIDSLFLVLMLILGGYVLAQKRRGV
ncbi:MAG: rhombotarget lipoprotein [Sulfurovum sp.]|nr:rhombotarget lipoprotein [Sulfurovum sp.]